MNNFGGCFMNYKNLRAFMKKIFIILFIFSLLFICAIPTNNVRANSDSIYKVNYSSYSGYEKYKEFEIGENSAEPIYVVCYKSKAESKYVSNGLVSTNGTVYAIQHVKGDEASISYSTSNGDSLTVGGGVGGSLGSQAGGVFNKVAVEVSLKIGFYHTQSSESGSTLTFKLGKNVPTGVYGIEECTMATQFIFDFYKATWKQVTETYKDGKTTKTRKVMVHDSYEKNKYSDSKVWMSAPNATVFYKLLKID